MESRCRAVHTLWVLLPAITACPLPRAHTEAHSAPIVGTVFRTDGMPAPRADVAVSTEWGDSSCARATLRTTTDSAGTFRLPAIQKRHGVTWLVPMFDRVAPRYLVCIGVADTLRSAYRGLGALGATAEPDSIECLEWAWNGRGRVTCSGKVEQAWTAGGRWTHDDASGWYRVILTNEPTVVRNRRQPQLRPHVYVQWLARVPGSAVHQVRETIELPIADNVTGLWTPALWQRGRSWYASLQGTKKTFLGGDFSSAELMFRLGSPGQATQAEAP